MDEKKSGFEQIKAGLTTLVNEGAEALDRAVDDLPGTVEKAKVGIYTGVQKVRKAVQNPDGLVHKVAKGTKDYVTKTGQAIDKIADDIADRTKKLYDEVTTDREFDEEKAWAYLKGQANTLTEKGQKAVEKLCTTAKGDFYKYFPKDEDLNGIYKGFGQATGKTYTTKELDAAVAFYKFAEENLNRRSSLRPAMLEDIRAHAFTTPLEVGLFYNDLNDRNKARRNRVDEDLAKYKAK